MNFIRIIEKHLQNKLTNLNLSSSRLTEAINYMIFGGKYLRALCVYSANEFNNGNQKQIDNLSIAVEFLHCYTLIHDDLPVIDNDDLRRSKPSCHIKFDEPTAIITGDIMQAIAFDCLIEQQNITKNNKINIIKEFSKVAIKICSGQMLDINIENINYNFIDLENIYLEKTASLIKTSLLIGLIANDYSSEQYKLISRLGDSIGLLFQIQDDYLGATKTTNELGKMSNIDERNNKITYAKNLNLANSRITELQQDIFNIVDELKSYDNSQCLISLIDKILNRSR